MVGSGIAEGIGTVIFSGIIGIVLFVALGIYNIVDFFFIEEKIESTTILIPEIKLKTDGKTIDTIYVYKNLK